MEESVIILTVLGLAIVLRLVAGGLDHGRVRRYVESRGGKVLDTSWDPFGPGWFGERSDRIYSVRYVDSSGNTHHASCKTSLWTGVYFTEDRTIRRVEQPTDRAESVEEENRRLREELAQMKREKGM